MQLVGLILATALGSAVPAPAGSGVAIGYVAAFKGLDRAVGNVQFKNYTHLDLAFVNPTPEGQVIGEDGLACAPDGDGRMISTASLDAFVAKAHGAGTKVLASLGGAVIPDCGGDWKELLRPGTRDRLVASLVAMVDRYSLDGIDIDLEGELLTAIDRDGNYVPFVAKLGDALHARGKLLTAATGSYDGGMIPDASLPHFDLIGIMSYDAVGATWGTPGSEHSTYNQAQRDLTLWLNKGVPAAKLALGMPFYGRGFGHYRAGWSLAEIAATFGADSLSRDVAGQACGGCDYITYNGLVTLERKARLAAAWGAGVMVWEVGQDMPDQSGISAILRGVRGSDRHDEKH